MTEFNKIKKQFLPQFRETKIELVHSAVYCVCHVCPHNHDKYLCPEGCEETGGSNCQCKLRSCKIFVDNPEECEEQISKILGKPQCLVWCK
jgi:hypothetical protein